MRKRTSAAVAGIVGLAALLALSACSSGTKSSSSGGGSSAGSGSTASGGVIKIMTETQWDVPQLQLEDLGIIVKNGANYLNSHGGINGAKVQVEVCNDKFDPNTAEACARQAIANKDVAIVGGYSSEPAAEFPLLEKAGIAWIGNLGVPGTPSDLSPISFTTAGITFQTFAVDVLAAETCKSTVAIISTQGALPPGEQAFLAAPFVKKGNAAAFKGIVSVPLTATDLAPTVAAAAKYNPDCIVTGMSTNIYAELLSAMQEQGVLHKWTVYGQNGDGIQNSFVKQYPAQTDGWIADTFYEPTSSTPQWQEYDKINKDANNLGSYLPNLDGGTEQWTWVGWQAFVKIVEGIKGPVTAATVLAATDKSCSVTLEGLSPDYNFCKTLDTAAIAREFDTSFVFVEAKNGTLVPLPGKTGFTDMYKEWVADGSPKIPGT
jgi:ABC-type branched-subunit amino acid transport system substrate-binding protein